MKNILLPVDLSDNSKHAVNYALNLYQGVACNFYFLHTYTPAVYSYEYQLSAGVFEEDFYDSIHKAPKEDLAKFVADVTKGFNSKDYKFHNLVAYNTLTDAIKEYVSQYAIEVIIMGTKGATSSSRMLFGTNTIQVINKRICPVIAVPETYEIKKPKEILFPTDFHIDYKERHISVLKDIAKQNNSKIHIFHVGFRGLSTAQRKAKDILETALEDINSDLIIAEHKDIPVAINDYKKEQPVDLLMMINNKHLFFENLLFRPVISSIAMDLKTPLLVVNA